MTTLNSKEILEYGKMTNINFTAGGKSAARQELLGNAFFHT